MSSRTARTNSIDTVSVNASAGTNNSGTITYAQSTTDSASGATFGSSSSFTQPRNSTRYYFAKQSNLISDTVEEEAQLIFMFQQPSIIHLQDLVT